MVRTSLLVISIILYSALAMGEENFVMLDHNATSLTILSEEQQTSPLMVIKFDGTIEIDGVPIERLSDPEIKESLKKIAESLSRNSISMMRYYENQNTALMALLWECQDELRKLQKEDKCEPLSKH